MLGEWRRRGETGQGSLWQEALEAGFVWQARDYDYVVRTEVKTRRVAQVWEIRRNGVPHSLP